MIPDKIERTKRSIRRAGSILANTMKAANQTGVLTGEQAFEIYNSYGVTLDIILLIANSHDLKVEEEEFHKLVEEQHERMKNVRQCSSEMK